MNTLIRHLFRTLALLLAVTALTFGVARPATASAADLNFTGTTVSGGTFDGNSLAGRPAVLWFWTPWCPFCNQEAPNVAAVSAANPAVTFVGIATRADNAALQGFISKYGLGFTNINDADGSIWAKFNVPWQPAYVFLRPDGSSSFVNNPTSAMSQQELSDRVKALTS
ncbi:protein disulfide oxidoreductase [Mycolicibacterium sp.]|uniref:protein disulfide oxidoreductase n=1 Tax=Mycolicibacterium sp. TaxID=2320850 RepID=UPI0028ADA24A|nr:protein disulfide oxidoreductase [Mycolicibacterium sp.]